MQVAISFLIYVVCREMEIRSPYAKGFDIPCLSAYSFLFSLTRSEYLWPNLPSSITVTITAGGFPEGTWVTDPMGPLRACLEPPPHTRRNINARQKIPAIAIACFRYRRGRVKPWRSGRELLARGRNGAGFEDFRGGYGRCMVIE